MPPLEMFAKGQVGWWDYISILANHFQSGKAGAPNTSANQTSTTSSKGSYFELGFDSMFSSIQLE